MVVIFEAFWADSEKYETNVFRIGSDRFTFLDFAARNGIQNIFFFRANMFIGHIFNAYLITNMYFFLFLGFTEKQLMAFVQF